MLLGVGRSVGPLGSAPGVALLVLGLPLDHHLIDRN
jgi:hypothetical protein